MTEPIGSEQTGTQAPASGVMGPRIGAALIDIAILAVVFFVFGALFGDSSTSSGDDGSGFSVNLTGFPALIYFVLVLAYYFVLEGSRGQTVGKMALALRVVRADGSPLTSGHIAARTILRIVDGLPAFYILGLIVAAASKNDQRIGDMAAGTLVVRT